MSVADRVNYFVDKYNYQSYLEIGIHRGKTFKEVECSLKVGVEPAGRKKGGIYPTHAVTSDEFFSQNKDRFDIIFIDGLHHADQFRRDVLNSLNSLNEGGAILCHDVNPRRESEQLIPRGKGQWTGDVWKGWVTFRATRQDLWMYAIEGGVGLGVIRKGEQETTTANIFTQLDWENFDKNRREWLNLVSWEELQELLNEK